MFIKTLGARMLVICNPLSQTFRSQYNQEDRELAIRNSLVQFLSLAIKMEGVVATPCKVVRRTTEGGEVSTVKHSLNTRVMIGRLDGSSIWSSPAA